ncbi:MAG: fibronectin type III domain-containing protein [Gammaproteobacteria bacterium]|nr:fibronectin type III domain-containing protein [Gammaproteobacteria bacterium]
MRRLTLALAVFVCTVIPLSAPALSGRVVVEETPGTGNIRLAWDPVPGATGYQVRYREMTERTFGDFIDVAATQYTITGVSGTQLIQVRAVSKTEFSSKFRIKSAPAK